MKKTNQKVMKIICPDCGGSRMDDMDESMFCPFCDGKGTVLKSSIKGTIFDD